MKIGNKEYMLVNDRVAIFRNTYPTWSLPTCIEELKDGFVVFKATVIDENGHIRATGHAYEKENSTFINKTSYIENCETSAVGRALGFLGIGIEGSIATAEEVQNAMLQQSDGEEDVTAYDETINTTMAGRIENIMKLNKTKEETTALWKLFKAEFNISKLSELKNGQYPDAVKWLEGK
jgi:hypothetical protein